MVSRMAAWHILQCLVAASGAGLLQHLISYWKWLSVSSRRSMAAIWHAACSTLLLQRVLFNIKLSYAAVKYASVRQQQWLGS